MGADLLKAQIYH